VNGVVVYIRTAREVKIKDKERMEILETLRENIDKSMTTRKEFEMELLKGFGVMESLRATSTAVFAEFFIRGPFKVKSRKRLETKTSDLKRKKRWELGDVLLKGEMWEGLWI